MRGEMGERKIFSDRRSVLARVALSIRGSSLGAPLACCIVDLAYRHCHPLSVVKIPHLRRA
jgi:hypothetical protein